MFQICQGAQRTNLDKDDAKRLQCLSCNASAATSEHGDFGTGTKEGFGCKRPFAAMHFVSHQDAPSISQVEPITCSSLGPRIVGHRIHGKVSNVDWLSARYIAAANSRRLGGSDYANGKLLFTHRHMAKNNPDGPHEIPPDQYYAIGSVAWTALTKSEKLVYIGEAILRNNQGQGSFSCKKSTSVDNHRLPLGVLPEYVDQSNNMRCSGYLLTFHGIWGQDMFSQEEIDGCSMSEQELQAKYKEIRGAKEWSDLADRFQAHIVKAAQKRGFTHVSTAVEFCLKSHSAMRVHLHATVSGGRSRLTAEHFDVYTFDGFPVAHVSFSMSNRVVDSSRKIGAGQAGCPVMMPNSRRTTEAHYYLQYPKEGMLAQRTNHFKWNDFAVKSRWIKNQLAKRKITISDAIREAIESRDSARSFVTELEWLMQKESELFQKERALFLQSQVKQGQRPFKPDPAIVLAWKDQYNPARVVTMSRFRPLVLEGPSRFGKSSYALSMYDPGTVLVLNCQDVKEPNLKSFDLQKHQAIIFEEASGAMIVANKMLFQAGVHQVQLGQSATNCNAYKRLLHGVRMIVCTNSFITPGMADHDRQWLEQNVFYLQLTEPCFT